jgi:predicted DNA-binding protein (MmcQ/YjbR family)
MARDATHGRSLVHAIGSFPPAKNVDHHVRPARTIRCMGVKARKVSGGGMRELTQLRKICLTLPGAVEKLSHGEPNWFTGPKRQDRVFASFDNHHHGAPHISVWVPAPLEVQQALVKAQPDRYWVPPYVGHKGWVAIILDTKPDWRQVAKLVEAGFHHVSGRR